MKNLRSIFTLKRSLPLDFEDAKGVLVTLLTEVGEAHWASIVSNATRTSFRGLCGGMGSLNDLTICPENSHKVDDRTAPRANVLLNASISLCFETSSSGPLNLCVALDRFLGCPNELTGFGCIDCGYSGTTTYHVLSHLEPHRLRKMLSDCTGAEGPADMLLRFWRTEMLQSSVNEFIRRLHAAAIEYSDLGAWMRECRACGSGNTCAYRWRVSDTTIKPSSDNLTIGRGAAAQ